MSEVGSIWYKFWGNSEATRRPALVYRRAETRGKMSDCRRSVTKRLLVMFPGTSEAHIMLPGL
jgi:hypothetical protein